MTKISLKASTRKVTGRKVKTLRKKGIIPANVFGRDVVSTAIEVSSDDFRKIFRLAGETQIIELSVGSKKKPVLISNVQVHPVSGEILHVDFKQVDLKKSVSASVPVVLVGESPAEKSGIGVLVQQLSEIEVEALPTNIPEKFEVDVSGLTEVESHVSVVDLKIDTKRIKIELPPDQIVAIITPPQKEEIAPAPPVEGEVKEEKPEGEVEPSEKSEGQTQEG